MYIKSFLKITALSFFTMTLMNNSLLAGDPPVELGQVKWLRNLEEGITQAETEKKSIFILFQEVPGCATCQNYGKNVLSHPLIVDAIETLFVPVAIFNNKRGEDAIVLKSFGEPAWNNPVVRIVNKAKKDVVKRIGGNYSQLGIVQAMVEALQAEGRDVPAYLALLEKELLAEHSGLETANLSMYCFWTGEKQIGQIDGVVETQPGFMGGREVVQVQFDPEVVSYEKLVKKAVSNNYASHVYVEDDQQRKKATKLIGKTNITKASSFRIDREPKYYLSKTIYQYIPMTDLQAVKVNSLIGQNKSPDDLLSPRQLDLLGVVKASPKAKWSSAINADFLGAWNNALAKVTALKG